MQCAGTLFNPIIMTNIEVQVAMSVYECIHYSSFVTLLQNKMISCMVFVRPINWERITVKRQKSCLQTMNSWASIHRLN